MTRVGLLCGIAFAFATLAPVATAQDYSAMAGMQLAEPEFRPGDDALTCDQIMQQFQAAYSQEDRDALQTAAANATAQGQTIVQDGRETAARERVRNAATNAAGAAAAALGVPGGDQAVWAANEARNREIQREFEGRNRPRVDAMMGSASSLAAANSPRAVALMQLAERKGCE